MKEHHILHIYRLRDPKKKQKKRGGEWGGGKHFSSCTNLEKELQKDTHEQGKKPYITNVTCDLTCINYASHNSVQTT